MEFKDQTALAHRLGSSQSRVAKMEAARPLGVARVDNAVAPRHRSYSPPNLLASSRTYSRLNTVCFQQSVPKRSLPVETRLLLLDWRVAQRFSGDLMSIMSFLSAFTRVNPRPILSSWKCSILVKRGNDETNLALIVIMQ
jgi:hypothetical protein